MQGKNEPEQDKDHQGTFDQDKDHQGTIDHYLKYTGPFCMMDPWRDRQTEERTTSDGPTNSFCLWAGIIIIIIIIKRILLKCRK